MSNRWGQLADRIGELASVPSRVAKDASKRIAKLIDDQFNDGVDPYGQPWAPLMPATIAKGRRPPPLTDTRELRDGVSVSPRRGSGIAIDIESDYGQFHQLGTDNMLARPILPAGSDLPEEWDDAIETSLTKAFRGVMG